MCLISIFLILSVLSVDFICFQIEYTCKWMFCQIYSVFSCRTIDICDFSSSASPTNPNQSKSKGIMYPFSVDCFQKVVTVESFQKEKENE